MPATQQQLQTLAQELLAAESQHAPVAAITDRVPGFSVEDAYGVQAIVLSRRLSDGRKIVGRKVGLTSKAMQTMFGVDQPDYGVLLDNMLIKNRAAYPMASLLQPRIEPEIAFKMKKGLRGPNVTLEQVLDATDYVFPSLEVIDSRIRDWKIKLQDTIADNASSARVVVGTKQVAIDGLDLAKEELTFEKNGEVLGRATGEAVLGNPANAVAWLANTLHRYGASINAGDIVMPGALTGATPVKVGDTVKATFKRVGTVSVRFV
jgi:2-keto-4-pentenoate hydratase